VQKGHEDIDQVRATKQNSRKALVHAYVSYQDGQLNKAIYAMEFAIELLDSLYDTELDSWLDMHEDRSVARFNQLTMMRELGLASEAISICNHDVQLYQSLNVTRPSAVGRDISFMTWALKMRAETLSNFGNKSEALSAWLDVIRELEHIVATTFGHGILNYSEVPTLALHPLVKSSAQYFGHRKKKTFTVPSSGRTFLITGAEKMASDEDCRDSSTQKRLQSLIELAYARISLGLTLESLDQVEEASQAYGASASDFLTVLAEDDRNIELAENVVMARWMQLRLDIQMGKGATALNTAVDVLTFAEQYGVALKPYIVPTLSKVLSMDFSKQMDRRAQAEKLYFVSASGIERYLDRQIGDWEDSPFKLEENVDRFWLFWIDMFIGSKRYDLLLDAVSRLNSRRTAAQAHAALVVITAAGQLQPDQVEYIALHQMLRDVELRLIRESSAYRNRENVVEVSSNDRMSSAGSGSSGEASPMRSLPPLMLEPMIAAYLDQVRELKQLSQQLKHINCDTENATGHRKLGHDLRKSALRDAIEKLTSAFKRGSHHVWELHEQRRSLTKQIATKKRVLIDLGKLPALAADFGKGMRAIPAGQALAIWVCPDELARITRSPVLLMIQQEKVDLLFHGGQELNFSEAQSLERALAKQLTVGRCVREAGTYATCDDTPSEKLYQTLEPNLLDTRLRGFLHTNVWQPLLHYCESHEISMLHMVTAGDLHALPWEGSAPQSLSLQMHPGIFSFGRYCDAVDKYWPSPQPNRPLLVLANDASDEVVSCRRLYCVPLEIAFLRAVWGANAVHVVEQLPTEASIYAAFVCLGHGVFDPDNGQAGLDLGTDAQTGEQVMFSQAHLSMDTNIYRHVEASACVMGRMRNIGNEPCGLIATALIKPHVQMAIAPLLPVDDLLAALRTMLFHVLWRNGSAPHAAARASLDCLESGVWPAEATQILSTAFTRVLPDIALAIDCDMTSLRLHPGSEQRRACLDALRATLTLESSAEEMDAERLWQRMLLAARQGQIEDASDRAAELANLVVRVMPPLLAGREDIQLFTRYWMIC